MGWKERLRNAARLIGRHPLMAIAGLVLLGILGNLAMQQAERFPKLACSPCHVMGSYVEGYDHGELLANKHKEAHVDCIDCHDNGIEDKVQETIWYVTDDIRAGKYFDADYKRLKK